MVPDPWCFLPAKYSWLLIFTFISVAITRKEAKMSSPTARPQIVLMGDSITQMSFSSPSGFGAHLANIYQRRADVLNRGFSGYNTNWILELLETEEGHIDILGIASPPPRHEENGNQGGNDGDETSNDAVKLTIIFFGANDSSDPVLNARQHVPLDEYKANLKKIVTKVLRACPKTKIILIAPPPIDHEARLKYQIDRYGTEKATGKLERTLELSGTYAAATCAVAKDLSVPCLNVWADMQSTSPTPKWHNYLSDGLHLSPEGNEFVGKGLEALIRKEYPDLAVNACPITGLYANSGSSCDSLQQFGPWHDSITDPEEFSPIFKKQKTCSQ